MSFLSAAALAVGLLVAVPLLAHLLRRGRVREQQFPPATLVPAHRAIARQRARLDDRTLLISRILIIVALAILGATPLMQCSRLSLARSAGASVALAVVVDDSHSMRADVDGSARFERAIDAAQDLLSSAREGDAVAIVLAGAPARIRLSATTDLTAAREALDALEPTDRATDIANAVKLAHSSLERLPHVDKRVVVLSDQAGQLKPEQDTELWAPVPELAKPTKNCGIALAERRGRHVEATIGCSNKAAAQERSVEIIASDDTAANSDAGETVSGTLASTKLASREGSQTVSVSLDSLAVGLSARLTGQDALASDDVAPVAPEAASLTVAVVSDTATGRVITGGPPVLEQALTAIAPQARLRPMARIPDETDSLQNTSALLIDDPTGLTPEQRQSLSAWLEDGGVALALLGPGASKVSLGSSLEPFAHGRVTWESTDAKGVEPASAAWLAEEAGGLDALAPEGRAKLEGALMPEAEVRIRWADGAPWLAERAVGRGQALTLGLPSSPRLSDLVLRPGFLLLLDHVLQEARRSAGPRVSMVGLPWSFPGDTQVAIQGPTRAEFKNLESQPDTQKTFVPELAGRYRVKVDGKTHDRIATIDPAELTQAPKALDKAQQSQASGAREQAVDVSPEIALIALLLFVTELGIRLGSRFLSRRRARSLQPQTG